jgi:hypothetical protein
MQSKLFDFKEQGILANKKTKREFVLDLPLSVSDDG